MGVAAFTREQTTIQDLTLHDRGKLTADLQGGFQLQEDGLAQEDFTGLEAKATDFPFGQLDVLPWPGSFDWGTH